MDLFRSTRTQSIRGKKYRLVVVDDYSRFTWVFFLANKVEVLSYFSKFAKKVQNEKGYAISSIKTNYGGEIKIKILQVFVMKMAFNMFSLLPTLGIE